jgi:Domain of unknown function (DUF4340)
MKTTGMLVAAAVLLALTGVLYWSDRHPAKDSTTSASSTAEAPAPKILTLKDSDISKIDIKKKGADPVELTKDAAGKWQIAVPKALSADQDAVTSLVSSVASLNSDRLVDDKPSDLKQYGLTEPALEVDITTKDKPQKILLGDDTPTGSATFAILSGDPRVFTIASYTKSSLDKSANDLRDKRLLTVDFDKVSQIELIAKKQDMTFAREKDTWQILKPKPLRADNSQVEELSRKLKDAKMDVSSSAPDEKKAAAAFASGTPVATAKLTGTSGTQELQIRKAKEDYYAKSTAVPGIYKVPNDIGSGLDKSLDDFRNKKLFNFGFTDVNKLEMHDGAKSYFLTKGGQDWWIDGKKMDPINVETLVDKVRELSASKFVDNGFTTPVAVDLSVTSHDGKQVEKVQIAKSGDNYIAKRENEAALYQLEANAVTELQKSAADIKPLAEPKPTTPPTKK